MFKILDGREKFYQWDLDRKLIVEDAAITEVHFCNRTDSCSLVCETFKENGLTLVNVPNILLQTNWKIHVYAYDGSYTKHEECYEVVSRTKPADYVYTETELWTAEKALEKALEDIIASGELKGEKGDKGDPGAIEFIVVSSLPTTNIKTNAIYLVPVTEITDENYYEEYIYNNFTGWEKIGNVSPAADLEDYLTINKLNNYLENNQIKIGYLTVSSIISVQEVQANSVYAYDWDSYYTITSPKSLGMLLDNKAEKTELDTKANDMKLLYSKIITADDGDVSFIEFLPETPLRHVYIYMRCPKGTSTNTNKLYFKFGTGSYVANNTGWANIDATNSKWGICEIDIDTHKFITHAHNISDGYGGNSQNFDRMYMNDANTAFYNQIYTNETTVKNLISGIKFSTENAAVYFPNSTRFYVWGC